MGAVKRTLVAEAPCPHCGQDPCTGPAPDELVPSFVEPDASRRETQAQYRAAFHRATRGVR